MKLINKHILLFVIVFSTFLGALKFTMPQHINVNAVSNHISSKESSVTRYFEKSLDLLLIEDRDISLCDIEDTKHHFFIPFFYILIIVSYLNTEIKIINIFFRRNQKKYIRERDKYQLYLSLQVPS